ncbi:NHLP leader peptide family RiPP precursor [Myxococcota bacterium]|nr:NHLP leader peptide family RiPP precursor [Myxococcota bacterium]
MKKSDKNRAILAESIARSWRESDFRQQLASDPKGTLKSAGVDIPDDHEVAVLENSPNLLHAVLPEISQMDEHDDAFNSAVAQLRNLPENVEVRIVRDTANKSHVVLPVVPQAVASGEMSDSDLEQIAGGKNATANVEAYVAETSAVQTEEVVNTTTEAQDVETTSTAVAEVEIVLVPCFVS